jgi:hypothetical protein
VRARLFTAKVGFIPVEVMLDRDEQLFFLWTEGLTPDIRHDGSGGLKNFLFYHRNFLNISIHMRRSIERLKLQSDTQFDELLFRLENSYPKLHGHISSSVALSQRAIQLIRFLEQDTDGLGHLGKQLNEPFTVPCTAMAELENLLQRAKIPDDTVRRVFDAYLKTLGNQATWVSLDYTSKPLWECLFRDLLDPSWMKSSEQHHLLQFIGRLAPYASHPFALRLRGWIRKTAIALGVAPPRIFHVDHRLHESEEKPQPYLLLALSPEGNYYMLHAWFMSDPGEYDRIYEEKLGSTLDDMPRHLNIILAKPEITDAYRWGNPPVLEFFLPVKLLNRDLDQWRLPGEKRPLSTQYCLVVRAGERLWGKRWIPDWGRYWNLHRSALCEAADRRRTAWLTRPQRGYSLHLNSGRWLFGLHFVPDSDCLETLLEAGIGILLWPRQEVKRITLSIKTQIAEQITQDLPEWLRQWRNAYWEKCGETGPLSLLWDDPRRQPNYHEPLPPHPDF